MSKAHQRRDSLAAQLNWDELLRLAIRHFGIKRFRPGQQDLIESVLLGKDAIGILPTGGGKSLCFQLPSILLKGTTVVVSPLIALMQDQSEKLADLGIEAARLDSTLTSSEVEDARDAIADGAAEIVYVTPERLENADYLSLLEKSKVTLFVVDEAHCISQWGHDFRPAYLNLKSAIHKLGSPPVLALTATATDDIAQDIIKQLGLHNPKIVRRGIERPNLKFTVSACLNEQQKKAAILQILDEHEGSGIIYTATIKAAELLFNWLREQGINAGLYHGKMRNKDREEMQQAFMRDDYKVIVATKAFGLGIDKSNVRFVIHYQFPDSVETYYQEAGRAGRDGLPAQATLLYQLEDRRIQTYFLGGKYPTREECWRVYSQFTDQAESAKEGFSISDLSQLVGIAQNKIKVIACYLESAGVLHKGRRLRKVKDFQSDLELSDFLGTYEQRHASDRERLEQIQHYAQTINCRVRFLKDYFGEDTTEDCKVLCDNCQTPPSESLNIGAA